MKVFLNGKVVDADKAQVSVFDNGFLYGDGVYETLRTYGGKIWQLQKHLGRLRSSADLLKIKLPYSLNKIGDYIKELMVVNGLKEARIRVTLTRGLNGFNFVVGDKTAKSTLLIVAEKFVPEPDFVYERGVAVVTYRAARYMPEAKSLALLPMIVGRQIAAEKGVYEAIMIGPDGKVKEGTVTNVYAIKNGVVYTPRRGVLAGTTRDFIKKVCTTAKIKFVFKEFRPAFLKNADEVFISNAPRGIVPVVKVDSIKVGQGKLGDVVKKIMDLFDSYVQKRAA